MTIGIILVVTSFMLVIGVIGNAMGLTTTVISAPEIAFQTSVPIIRLLNPVGAAFGYAINIIAGFLQLQFFQAPIPAEINALIMIPLDFVLAYVIAKLARG